MSEITNQTCDLLIKIDKAQEASGGAIINPQALKRFQKLERAGRIEIHIMGSGRYCARMTKGGHDAMMLHMGENF